MALPTCNVVCAMHDQEGAPVAGAAFEFKLNRPEVYEGFVVPTRVVGTTGDDGTCTVALWPNQLGSAESAYGVTIRSPGGRTERVTATIPNVATVNLHEVSELPPYPGKPDAQVYLETAQGIVEDAQEAAAASASSASASAGSASAASASAASSSGSAAASAGFAAAAGDSAGAASASSATASGFASAASGSAAAAAGSASAAASAAAAVAETQFPAGTAMLFIQSSAPTGWTKSTTHNNKALRIVSGVAGSGGSVVFTTAFSSKSVSGSVGGTVLSTAQMPSHAHTYARHSTTQGSQTGTDRYPPTLLDGSGTTSSEGSNASHNHSFTGTAIDLAVAYVDAIICTKD